MAEYLIQSDTLNAIAEAINQKAGTQNAMTPAQMVTAIGSISGEKVLTKIGEYTISNAVSVITITPTEQMIECDGLYFKLVNIVLSASDYIYPYINNSQGSGATSMGYTAKNSSHNLTTFLAHKKPILGGPSYYNYLGGLTNYGSARQTNTLTAINFRLYDSASLFNSGTIEVWGYV